MGRGGGPRDAVGFNELPVCDEKLLSGDCEENALKSAGDDTCVEFFHRVRDLVKAIDSDAVRDGTIRLDALQRWLQDKLGKEVLGIEHGTDLREQLEFEFGVVEDLKPCVS